MIKNDFSAFTHFFWDLDGTLTRSAEGIINSVRYSLESFGIKEDDDEKLKLFIGPPLPESYSHFYGFDEAQIDRAMQKYREYYSEKGIFENSVYEGIRETLAELKARGRKNYVATSKPEVFMKRILEHYDLAQFFEFTCGSDLAETRSQKHLVINFIVEHEKLQAAQKDGKILMIGDRRYDIIGAKKNGIKCCAVLWGYGSRKEFEENRADYIIKTPSELLE